MTSTKPPETSVFFSLGSARARALFRPPETRGQRKPAKNELKPFIDGLSHKDSRVRYNALANLSSLVFFTEIETEERLLPKLVRVLRDPDANVRKLALRLYEILNYYALPSHKAKFNKEILPLAIEVAKRDEDKEVRREALRVLTVTADETVAKLMVRMVVELPEDEYKTAIAANIWGSIVNSGLGLKFRNSLFKEFVSNTNQDVRRRIEEITQSHYPG